MLHMSLKLVIMYIIPRAMFVKVWPSTFKTQLLSTTNQNVRGPVGYASTKYKLGLIITLVCSETYLCTGIWILMNVKWPVNLVRLLTLTFDQDLQLTQLCPPACPGVGLLHWTCSGCLKDVSMFYMMLNVLCWSLVIFIRCAFCLSLYHVITSVTR